MTSENTNPPAAAQAAMDKTACGCGADCKCGPDWACGTNGTCAPVCPCEA